MRYDGYTCKVYRELSTPNNALVLYVDTKGRFWVGKYATGLSLYDPVKDRFVNFQERRADNESLHASYISSIHEDDAGILWFGTEDDIVSLDLGDASKETNADSVARHARFRTIPFGNVHPQMTYQDPQGRIWTGSKGLYLWEPETRSFKPVTNEGLADASLALPLGSDRRGRLWANYAGKGLGILDPHTNTFTNFDYSDGLLYPISMASLDDGRVALVGNNGMIIVHPDSLYAPGRAPQLVISKVSINDSLNVAAAGFSTAALRLSSDQNVLEFEFAAIDPGQGHLIEYRYRLEGLEDDMNSAGF